MALQKGSHTSGNFLVSAYYLQFHLFNRSLGMIFFKMQLCLLNNTNPHLKKRRFSLKTFIIEEEVNINQERGVKLVELDLDTGKGDEHCEFLELDLVNPT